MAGSDYSAATDAAMAGTDTAAATQVATDTGSPSTATATATAEDSVVEGQQPDLQPPVATSTATAPQPQTFDPKSWGIKYRDKVEYPKDAKHLLTLAQQGFGATQRLAEMNRREAELSQQSQKVQQYLALEEQFSCIPYYPMTDVAWESAKNLAWRLRDKGCTAPWNDILIASLSVKAGCRIYAVDKHFDLMYQSGAGIRLYRPGYGGKYDSN